ncbi:MULTISPECIES: bis(5'-nucleosyl)-tetraphosphatase (symmetrical) YqeK [unclassified Leptolyngbya]|uniref:bis(5'-nucleosyl)-tetraphosphatase (symmetrical) YqeK n=1 Tax=unclassified Leptolyngbya TaxID=2650499 RepID=UPI00168342B0|nr:MULTISPECIES: bis(5'-nucleosyl)-tetraphosphatase (symmetrical) YqeK [unclassified Leptolyngbya]MBD1913574.1 bis(5'-nucleosyl)-tetraphosphatase (symmetrical) YqeK [Leptolyngbya sp. FACHB-8]MBD2155855.1 bis(5'-nucleosyl)-tetraphosphatase (symmetrical) YqeK [Leptolyngbya sp. FACHB-16]
MAFLDAGLRTQVLDWMANQVPESRIAHVLRVEEMAIALAQQHQLDIEKAATAGLMHDLAKYFKPNQLLAMATAEGLLIDPVAYANPHLLHADVSALVARDEFGVRDPEVLAAIADHTLGRPNMGPLSCAVFLADTLEAGRGDSEELQTLRQISQQNLTRAVWMTCDYTLRYLLNTSRLIHPLAIETRNSFLHRDRWHAELPNVQAAPPYSMAS